MNSIHETTNEKIHEKIHETCDGKKVNARWA
jgi:hypothetical protein